MPNLSGHDGLNFKGRHQIQTEKKKKADQHFAADPWQKNTRLCPEVLSQEKAKEESYLNSKFGGMKISLRVQKNLHF